MSARAWAALVALGWASALLQTLTLAWVPDCGGVSYGLPLAYVQTSLASSLEFNLFLARFALDLTVYVGLVTIPAGLVVRRVLAFRCGARNAALALLLIPWASALLLVSEVETRLFATQLLAPERLYVREWRAVRPYLGLPDWKSHLEAHCN